MLAPLLRRSHQSPCFAAFVMVVIAGQRRLDAKVREQMLRVPGVLRGDQFDFFENPQRAQSDVFEIADGSWNDVEDAWHGKTET